MPPPAEPPVPDRGEPAVPADDEPPRSRYDLRRGLVFALVAVLLVVAGAIIEPQAAWFTHRLGWIVPAGTALLAILVLGLTGELARRPHSTAALAVVLIGWTAMRLAVAGSVPLLGDEAYHWLWARNLDLCYYDHPGMVAWLARLLCPPTHDANLCVRLSPVLLTALLPLLAWQLARETLADPRLARRCALLLMLTPICAASIVLMPYVPLNVFWLAGGLLAWRALERDRWHDWLLAGLACGAAMNCNFTAILLPASLVLYLLISRADRCKLAGRGFWLAVVVWLVCLTPIVVWNAQHGWATILFNAARRHAALHLSVSSVVSYLGQLLIWGSPVVMAVAAVRLVPALWRAWRAGDRPVLYLSILAIVPLAAFLATASVLKPRGHYAMPAIAPLVILFVSWTHRPQARMRRWYAAAVHSAAWCAAGLLVGASLVSAIRPEVANAVLRRLRVRTPEKRVAELYGFEALGRWLDRQGDHYGRDTPTVVLAPSYSQAALVIYYAKSVDYAYNLAEEISPYGRAFEFWGSIRSLKRGCDAIVFWAGHEPAPEANRRLFERWFEQVRVVPTRAAPDALRFMSLLEARGYRGGLP